MAEVLEVLAGRRCKMLSRARSHPNRELAIERRVLRAIVAGFIVKTALACTPLSQPRPSHLCEWGTPLFTCDFARSQILPFLATYNGGPLVKNSGGTGLVSGFMLWCTVRALDPLHIIESGAYRGLGTWLLRKAAPTAQITVLSPAKPTLYIDARNDSVYHVGSGFKDFVKFPWDGIDKERTLIFFDDHQSEYRRTLEAFARGFRHLFFDDNYLPMKGDNFALKEACDGDGALRMLLSGNPYPPAAKFAYGMGVTQKEPFIITPPMRRNISAALRKVADVYYELPQLWPSSASRFTGVSPATFHKIAQTPLLSISEGRHLHQALSIGGNEAAKVTADDKAMITMTHQVYVHLNEYKNVKLDMDEAWPREFGRLSGFRPQSAASRRFFGWLRPA